MRVEDNSRLLIVTFLGKTLLRCLILVVSCATAKTKTKHFSTIPLYYRGMASNSTKTESSYLGLPPKKMNKIDPKKKSAKGYKRQTLDPHMNLESSPPTRS